MAKKNQFLIPRSLNRPSPSPVAVAIPSHLRTTHVTRIYKDPEILHLRGRRKKLRVRSDGGRERGKEGKEEGEERKRPIGRYRQAELMLV